MAASDWANQRPMISIPELVRPEGASDGDGTPLFTKERGPAVQTRGGFRWSCRQRRTIERARSSPGPAGHEGLPMEIPAQYLRFYAASLRRGSFQPGRTKWQV